MESVETNHKNLLILTNALKNTSCPYCEKPVDVYIENNYAIKLAIDKCCDNFNLFEQELLQKHKNIINSFHLYHQE